jgi:hypothetical protein
MKTATLPSIRVEVELREKLEGILEEGESLSAFVEASVRAAVRRRAEQAAFVARGMKSLVAARKSGHYVSADAAVLKLEEKLAAARAGKQPRSARR